jgi:hypothetical protein
VPYWASQNSKKEDPMCLVCEILIIFEFPHTTENILCCLDIFYVRSVVVVLATSVKIALVGTKKIHTPSILRSPCVISNCMLHTLGLNVTHIELDLLVWNNERLTLFLSSLFSFY